MITGTEYCRRKARISQNTLAKRSGVSLVTVRRMCWAVNPETTTLTTYMRVAEALGVSIRQLLQDRDESELEDGDRAAYPSQTDNPNNCLTVYRHEHGLSLEQLGQRLGGKTRECARRACASEHPPKKHIKTLAAYEGVTPEEFCREYGRNAT